PAPVTVGRAEDHGSGLAFMSRGPEHRVAALTLAVLLFLGGLMGTANLCVDDPLRYATPLMLLFASFVAAWFLGPWEFAVNLVVTPIAVLIAMWSSYDDPAGLAIQVVVNAGMLNAAALGVFVLRRRVQRLLESTQALTVKDPLTGLYNRRYLVEQAPRI